MSLTLERESKKENEKEEDLKEEKSGLIINNKIFNFRRILMKL